MLGFDIGGSTRLSGEEHRKESDPSRVSRGRPNPDCPTATRRISISRASAAAVVTPSSRLPPHFIAESHIGLSLSYYAGSSYT